MILGLFQFAALQVEQLAPQAMRSSRKAIVLSALAFRARPQYFPCLAVPVAQRAIHHAGLKDADLGRKALAGCNPRRRGRIMVLERRHRRHHPG